MSLVETEEGPGGITEGLGVIKVLARRDRVGDRRAALGVIQRAGFSGIVMDAHRLWDALSQDGLGAFVRQYDQDRPMPEIFLDRLVNPEDSIQTRLGEYQTEAILVSLINSPNRPLYDELHERYLKAEDAQVVRLFATAFSMVRELPTLERNIVKVPSSVS